MVYFSVTAAATVGFVDYFPVHWTTRSLAATECLFFVTVAINILGVVRSRAPLTPADHAGQSTAFAPRG